MGAAKRASGSEVTRPFWGCPPTRARRSVPAPRRPARAPRCDRVRTRATRCGPRVPARDRAATDPCKAWSVRYREFSELVDEVFGAALGRAYVREQVLSALDDRTAAQALEDGVE
ncbi:MAG: DUF3046 domain-containing protein, partial [Cellulosimicrobium funkei]